MAITIAGAILAVLVALPLAVYPALIKFFPTTLATLAVPFRLSKALEFVYFVVSFVVLLPAGVWLAGRYTRVLTRRDIDPLLIGLGNVGALALIVAVAKSAMAHAPRIGEPGREHFVRPLSWAVLVAIALLVCINGAIVLRPTRLLQVRMKRSASRALALGVLTLPLVFMPSSILVPSRGLAAAGIALAALVFCVFVAKSELRTKAHRPLEALAPLLIVLLAWDLRLARGDSLIRQAHWRTVFLGPANSVLHGGTMLVDVFAQYGPGTTYFLAGYFHFAPIGFGHFWLLVEVLDVGMFLIMYAVFRVAGLSHLLSLTGVALAIVTGVIANPMDDTLIPQRPIRLLLPLLVVLFVLLGERDATTRRLWSWMTALTLAACSILAIEVFVYAFAVVLCSLACRARLDADDSHAIRVDRRGVARVLASLAAAQLVFAVGTRLAAGAWPNWPGYFQYARRYASGEGSQPFAPFQPGLLLGLFYFSSAATLVSLLIWARPSLLRQRMLAVSVSAATGLGVAYFSYYAGQSQIVNIYKMAPVAVLLAVLWIALGFNARAETARFVSVAMLFVVLWTTTLGLTVHSSTTVRHFEHTALLAAPSATLSDIRFVARNPVVDPHASEAAAFVRRAMPRSDHILVLLPEELTTEVLLRVKRVELIPMSDPYAESLLPARVSYLERVASELPVGTLFVSNTQEYSASRADVINDLDALIIRKLRETFEIRPTVTGPSGLRVYRLDSRRA